jgi:RNA polymerase sigma factor (sigma-70 family)
MDDDLIKLVKTYRLTRGLAERLGLAERIVPLIQHDLKKLVFRDFRLADAEDVFQNVLAAIAKNLGQFRGNTTKEFWGWCNTIARNKIINQIDRKQRDRLQPMPDEELELLLETSVAPGRLSAADRHDLDYALKLLTRSKPECRDYLWNYFVQGLDYAEMAAQEQLTSNNVRMRIVRCLETAQALLS